MRTTRSWLSIAGPNRVASRLPLFPTIAQRSHRNLPMNSCRRSLPHPACQSCSPFVPRNSSHFTQQPFLQSQAFQTDSGSFETNSFAISSTYPGWFTSCLRDSQGLRLTQRDLHSVWMLTQRGVYHSPCRNPPRVAHLRRAQHGEVGQAVVGRRGARRAVDVAVHEHVLLARVHRAQAPVLGKRAEHQRRRRDVVPAHRHAFFLQVLPRFGRHGRRHLPRS